MTRPVVVADAGPLIAMAASGHLHLLARVFAAIHVPQAVMDETTSDRTRLGAGDIFVFVDDHCQVHPYRQDANFLLAAANLDKGEAQAISLAQALGCGVLIDERRSWQMAARKKPARVWGAGCPAASQAPGRTRSCRAGAGADAIPWLQDFRCPARANLEAGGRVRALKGPPCCAAFAARKARLQAFFE